MCCKRFLKKYVAGEASEEYIADYFDYIKNQKKNLMENIGEFSPLYVFLMDQKLLPVADVDDL